MNCVPFLRPLLVTAEEILPYLRRIDATRVYSNFGPLVIEFEQRLIEEHLSGTGAVTTVQNATIGLMLAIEASRRQGGRYAVMPSFTFAATPQAALWCGLEPYFVDIRGDDFCADEALIEQTIEALSDDVAVVVPYAAFGSACSLDYYRSLHERGCPVVVDAAASFGAKSCGRQFGTGFPGAVVFSFHATKSFGIGEGGLVYSGDESLIGRVRRASNFGFAATRESESRGLNGKLSEYSAAVGLATLDRFSERIRIRRQLYESYVQLLGRYGLSSNGWGLQKIDGEVAHQFMGVLCPERLDNRSAGRALSKIGIQTRTYFAPACHEQPAFRNCPRTTLSETESVARQILNLPLWEDMTGKEVEHVVQALARI